MYMCVTYLHHPTLLLMCCRFFDIVDLTEMYYNVLMFV